MLLEKEIEVSELLQSYVKGHLSQKDFNLKYGKLLPELEEEQENLCHPLNIIISTEENSERAWKEEMREVYLREIQNLDNLLEENEPSYSEKLTEKEQKELCKEALLSIPRAALDRSSKLWIEENLVEDEEFVFFKKNGVSKFGSHKTLFKNKLIHESFLMTALDGKMNQLGFEYKELIKHLKENNQNLRSVWLHCSEPDGYHSIENTSWYTDSSQEVENLNLIERTDQQNTQGGICHLVFMPEDREWMLVHSNNFESFEVQLHGSNALIESILAIL